MKLQTIQRACAAVLALLLLAAGGCGSDTNEPWLQEPLPGDFQAGPGSASSLADYLDAEDALFEALDRQVYERVGTGPAQRLNRYSAGSAADPRGDRPNWNRTVILAAGQPRAGVLLLHGMSDSPYSLRALGTALNRAGCYVVALRLPGHGTTPAGLLDARWQDMSAAVELAMIHLRENVPGKPLHIVGYSTGPRWRSTTRWP